MGASKSRLAGLLALAGVGCTTIIGLPDLPDATPGTDLGGVMSGGGSPSRGGSTEGDDPSPNTGGSSSGASTGGVAGSSNLGGTAGTSATAGTNAGDICAEPCAEGMRCEAGRCVCSDGLNLCDEACVDLQTDAEHCGTCTKTCEGGCSAGRCFVQVATIPERTVVHIAVNATHVYYTVMPSGEVLRASRNGGMAQVMATSQDQPRQILLDSDNAYWINDGDSPSIMKMPLEGGTPVVLATGTAPDAAIDAAIDATHLYWIDASPEPGAVMKVPVAGGDKVVLATGEALTNSATLAVDGTSVYWTGWTDDQGGVWKVPIGGGEISKLVNVDGGATYGPAVHGGDVYFESQLAIQKVSKAGGAAAKVFELTMTGKMVVDETGIYVGGAKWPDSNAEHILWVSLDGASMKTLAIAVAILDSAVYGDHVFWADHTGTINMTLKTP